MDKSKVPRSLWPTLYIMAFLCRNDAEACSHDGCFAICQQDSCDSRSSEDNSSDYSNIDQILASFFLLPSVQVGHRCCKLMNVLYQISD